MTQHLNHLLLLRKLFTLSTAIAHLVSQMVMDTVATSSLSSHSRRSLRNLRTDVSHAHSHLLQQ